MPRAEQLFQRNIKIYFDALCAGVLIYKHMRAKNLSLSNDAVAMLEAVKVKTGASHSETARRAILIYCAPIIKTAQSARRTRK